jgi:hypothetical protein
MKIASRFFTFLTLLVLIFSALGVTPAHAAGILHVTPSASGTVAPSKTGSVDENLMTKAYWAQSKQVFSG